MRLTVYWRCQFSDFSSKSKFFYGQVWELSFIFSLFYTILPKFTCFFKFFSTELSGISVVIFILYSGQLEVCNEFTSFVPDLVLECACNCECKGQGMFALICIGRLHRRSLTNPLPEGSISTVIGDW